MSKIAGESFEIYVVSFWKIVGNLYQSSLENRWYSLWVIVGRSLKIYVDNRWKIVANSCRLSLENRWNSVPILVGKSFAIFEKVVPKWMLLEFDVNEESINPGSPQGSPGSIFCEDRRRGLASSCWIWRLSADALKLDHAGHPGEVRRMIVCVGCDRRTQGRSASPDRRDVFGERQKRRTSKQFRS